MTNKFNLIAIGFLFILAGFIVPKKSYPELSIDPTMRVQPHRLVRTGSASWYSEQSPGIRLRTANNEIFDDSDLTCAMWDVPFGQRIKVTNRANGKSIIVRVNDRGPHSRFVRQGRIIDLTKNAFSKLAELDNGLIQVELEFM